MKKGLIIPEPRLETVKLVLFSESGEGVASPGLLTDRGVVDISPAVQLGYTPELTMEGIINDFDVLRPRLEWLAVEGKTTPLDKVRLLPPLPRPGKILACIANYWEHAQREPRQLNMFLKSPDAVVGPGEENTAVIWVKAPINSRNTGSAKNLLTFYFSCPKTASFTD